jgi:hypothetical protein
MVRFGSYIYIYVSPQLGKGKGEGRGFTRESCLSRVSTRRVMAARSAMSFSARCCRLAWEAVREVRSCLRYSMISVWAVDSCLVLSISDRSYSQ